MVETSNWSPLPRSTCTSAACMIGFAVGVAPSQQHQHRHEPCRRSDPALQQEASYQAGLPADAAGSAYQDPSAFGPMRTASYDGDGGTAGVRQRNAGADPGWVIFEFNSLKERMAQMERKAETLWHVQVRHLLGGM